MIAKGDDCLSEMNKVDSSCDCLSHIDLEHRAAAKVRSFKLALHDACLCLTCLFPSNVLVLVVSNYCSIVVQQCLNRFSLFSYLSPFIHHEV